MPASRADTIKAGRTRSTRYWLATAISVIRRANSLGSRSCKVRKTRFGRIRRNEGDPHSLQGAVDLHQPSLVNLARGFLGIPLVRRSIGIQRTKEVLHLNDLPQAPEATHGPFFLDEEGRVDIAGRIISVTIKSH